MKKFALIPGCLLVCLMLVAQEKPAQTMKDMPAGAMQAPKPVPEMAKLKMIVGKWTTSEKHEPGPFMPKGGTAKGTATYSWGPGGMSVIEEYKSAGASGKFNGHGVIWWDDKEKGYRSLWCDNMTPGGCEVTSGLGRWEGEKIVFDSESEMMGKKMKWHEVLSDLTPNSYTLTMDLGPADGEVKRAMTIKFTRMGAAKGGEAAAETKKP